MNLKIGCCGFPIKRDSYAKQFKLVEIQQTFYQLPQPGTVKRWREEAPPVFEFTLKMWQLITHQPSSPTYRRMKKPIPESLKKNYGFFKPTDEVYQAWKETEAVASILQARLIVFQTPPSFTPTAGHMENMRSFFRQIDRKSYRLVWEPRGEWEESEVRALCHELDLIPCLDPFLANPEAEQICYIRMHGKGGYSYRYTDEDLLFLKENWTSSETNYFLFNNLSMYEDALRFQKYFPIQ